MKKVLPLYKPVSITPLQLIQQFQKENPSYQEQKLGYAGRLDPMAEGVLLVLVGDENKKRKDYERLEKEYLFEAIFGLQTDTHDTLGILDDPQIKTPSSNWKEELSYLLPLLEGKQEQAYPAYSSARVNGKPLFYWARKKKLKEIVIPTKVVEIFDLKMLDTKTITLSELKDRIFPQIDRVEGEFRQKEIKERWQSFFSLYPPETLLPVITFHIHCSSGTYIRSLCHYLGERLGVGALALSIKRTRVGPYTVEDTLEQNI